MFNRMGGLRRFPRTRERSPQSKGPLLTAIIARKCGGWTIGWPGGATFSPGGGFETLDRLAQATDTLLAGSGGSFRTLDALTGATDALVHDRGADGEGTLQYKIYPWGRPGVGDERGPADVFMLVAPGTVASKAAPGARPNTMFRVSESPGDLMAVEIAPGRNLQVRARTPDQLVSQVGEARGEKPDVLIWVRDIRSLRQAN